MKIRITCLFVLFLICCNFLYAQGIRGTIKGNDGTVLPFASVYISSLNTGTTANQEGKYEIKVSRGKYLVRVQNIGYKSVEAEVSVGDSWLDKDFTLSAQGYMLEEVKVGNQRKEDFAYTIMRKAIAKKKYRLLQCDSYQMKVYIKGTGELTKAPFFLKNKLKKEGLNLNEAYTTESVSQITFAQPNKVDEKVIAIRTKGTDNSGVSPSLFIQQSFYRDKIAGIISPFSNSAFRWYRFTYEGSFTEGSHEINKIRITPRSRGDNVFEGSIYIVDGQWAIHSLDLKTSIMGFPISLRQNYAELANDVWLPVTLRYQFSGTVLGFQGHYNYLASCRDYKLKLNKDLLIKAELVDEKVETAPEEIAALRQKPGTAPASLVPSNAKMSRRQFYKMMDDYEKQEKKSKNQDEQLLKERSFSTDSSATKRDSSYWDEVRSIPLTQKEQNGYRRDDSLALIQAAKIAGKDSLKVIKKRTFNPADLLFGGQYNLAVNTRLSIAPTITQTYFNTMEGFNVNLSAVLTHQYDSLRKKISFSPALRYGFSSRDVYAKAALSYATKRNTFSIAGGDFIEQFNSEDPINQHINTLSSLLFRRNFMKAYEKEYLDASWKYRPSAFLHLNVRAEWSQRSQLSNTSDYSFFYKDSREYSSNNPDNIELADASFAKHQALSLQASMSYRPWPRYRVYNGKRIALPELSPEFTLNYKKGIKNLLGSDVDYDQLELGMKHTLSVGAGNKLAFELLGGSFLNNDKMYFMDFKHFEGNRTFLSSLRPAGAFRLLDYYKYSTRDSYLSMHAHYQFRKFLLTRIPEVRYRGIRENVFVNYLKTTHSPNYYELGYSLDNVFRIFRIEVASSFTNGNYRETGFRIGIATIFSFGDN